ncbi:AP-1 complex subunit gamma-1-like protein [Rozella allomycis CSF55]|uniref:AP-1 complex subunit gamma n=1 Tax=Rozella allomycis (strain CSF55) TaxID=988480 RepID=A0A075AX26_ROZAC|nr:AP-1 complex subunit gamma-1-like protein [Rozella allomycis CSF55]|eukprot:EPZ33272.1 AP-1 complex subunit gamma-1-like protein [Rozella allomycis CSF55]
MAIYRLKELIKSIRACKTAADERALIAKESAAIRTALKEDNLDNRYYNVAKLLYIHMLNYPAHFGQIECLKLVSSPRFAHKRLGYLGIMMLLDENQEVLMLVTNSLKSDMNNSNMYIVGLALCTLGNISSVEMARDLCGEVERLLGSSNSYIRKKAALCALRIVRKVPDLYENFVSRCRTLLNERNHGVLMTGITLITEQCLIHKDSLNEYRKMVPSIVRHLKSLISGQSSSEHDVGGVADPFLQIKILRLLRILGSADAESSEQMNDILAQVATNTESSKNVGNAILYEAVLTILNIQADNSLRVMAINILGRFLTNKDNNIRYVALNTLTKTIDIDNNAVQRHRNIIIECLRDADISIKRRALELAFALINENTIRVLARELLLFLEVADNEFKASMVSKICQSADKYSPNTRWYIDTVLRTFSIAGDFAKEEAIFNLLKTIGHAKEIQAYATCQFFQTMQSGNLQEGLVLSSLWLVGEFGEVLLNGGKIEDEDLAKYTEDEVIGVVSSILNTSDQLAKQYAITALVKLSSRFKNSSNEIRSLISKFQSSLDVELQQRSVEYSSLLSLESAIKNSILENIPPAPINKEDIGHSKENDDKITKTKNETADFLLELESLGLGGANQTISKQSKPEATLDLMADIFGQTITSKSPAVQSFQVYNNNGLVITFDPLKDSAGNVNIDVKFQNNSSIMISDFLFQAAVPKSMKLQLLPPSGSVILPSNIINQQMKVSNPSNVMLI